MKKYKLNINEKVINYLESNRIYLRPRFNFGDALGKSINVNGVVISEPYSRFHENTFQWEKGISIGAFSYISPNCFLDNTTIGRYTSIGSGTRLMGENHPIDRVTTSTITYGKNIKDIILKDFNLNINQDRDIKQSGRTIIGNDVWIGEQVTIKRGVTIGNGSIVGSNTVVTKDIPPFCIFAGNPGQIKKYRFDKEVIEKLEKSQWWNSSIESISKCNLNNTNQFLSEFSFENFDWKKTNLTEELMSFKSQQV